MNTQEYISSGIIESYILGLASPDEAGILECVMKNNAEVRAAFEEAQKILEDLATAQAVTPPHDLKSKIWNKIQQEKTSNTSHLSMSAHIPSAKPQEEIRTLGNSNWKVFSAAASVLLLVSLGLNIFWGTKQSEIQTEIAKLQAEHTTQNLAMKDMEQKLQITANPNMLKIVLNGVEKHPDSKAVVYWDKTSKDVYLAAGSLPKAPQGMQYQLWAIADGKPVSAGMYSEDKDSRKILSTIPEAQAFAITLEKEGGSSIPTMENMFVIGNI